MLMIGIGLDVPDADLRAQTELAMPVLRDVYVRSLMALHRDLGKTLASAGRRGDRRPAAARHRPHAEAQGGAPPARPGGDAADENSRQPMFLPKSAML